MLSKEPILLLLKAIGQDDPFNDSIKWESLTVFFCDPKLKEATAIVLTKEVIKGVSYSYVQTDHITTNY